MLPDRSEGTGMSGPAGEAASTSLPSSLANSIHQLRKLVKVTFSYLRHPSYFLLYEFLKVSELTLLIKSSFLHSQETQGQQCQGRRVESVLRVPSLPENRTLIQMS